MGIQSVQSGDQRTFVTRRDDILAREHFCMGAVDIQQGVEEVALGIFEVLREHRFSVNAGRKRFGTHTIHDSPRTKEDGFD